MISRVLKGTRNKLHRHICTYYFADLSERYFDISSIFFSFPSISLLFSFILREFSIKLRSIISQESANQTQKIKNFNKKKKRKRMIPMRVIFLYFLFQIIYFLSFLRSKFSSIRWEKYFSNCTYYFFTLNFHNYFDNCQ